MPAKTHKIIQKNEKQTIKQTKQKKILIAKTLEAFTPKAKFDPFKYSYFKNELKTNFSFENQFNMISARPEKHFIGS